MNRITDLFREDEHTYFRNQTGGVEAVQANGSVPIETAAGILIPCYITGDHGRHRLTPMRLFPDGNLKSVALQYPMMVKTPVGSYKAELVTFYNSGAVRRVFPLNGKIGGYWSEKDEYGLAESITIHTPLGDIQVKPLYLHFYETGELKSITFWPAERVNIPTPLGEVTIRRGISFYKSGALESCEPAHPVHRIPTPLGEMEAFDPDPNGMNGEVNSLRFTEWGELFAMDTIASEIIDTAGRRYFVPAQTRSLCSDTAFVTKPMTLQFYEDYLEIFNGKEKLDRIRLDGFLMAAPRNAEILPVEMACCE